MTQPEPQDINAYLANEWYKQGLEYFNLGDYSAALTSFKKALSLNPNNSDVWHKQGALLAYLRFYEEANAAYDRVLEINPNDHKAWFCRGLALFNLASYQQAIDSFDRAVEIKTDYQECWYSRGNALKELKRSEEAIASYDEALKIQPNFQEAWNDRGNSLNGLGRYEEAIASYGKALQIKPDNDQAWSNRGVALYKLGCYEEALTSFDKALEIKPDNPEAWSNRGNTLEYLGHNQEAIASCDRALQIKPDYHEAWNNRGNALGNLGQCEEAINSYDRAVQIKLDYWGAWIGRGSAVSLSVHSDPRLTAFSSIAQNNPALKQRGYEGALANYEEGLKYVHQDTHPEGWGKLHRAIGNAHYYQGWPFPYWHKAIKSYEEALKTLTEEAFPEAHLEVLQDLIRAHLSLRAAEKAAALLRRGSDLLRRLLQDPKRSDGSKRQLALKFMGLRQLTVDLYLQSGQLVKALTTAEKDKNACLSWLLGAWSNDIYAPSWVEIQQLLNSSTAFVYWHLSPAALTTFILKHNASEPILITTPIPTNGEEPPASVQRLCEFENWVKDWNQQYAHYRSEAKEKEIHSWRVGMEQRLEKLKNILKISAIEEELKGITQLILIPHRDLHRFAIHALFSDNMGFTITYLPSAQIGINLQQRQPNPTNHLLSVEHPTSKDFASLEFAQFESEAISQIFDKPKRIQSEDATKKQIEDALSAEYSIFHFTGHGTYNFSNPRKSELALANEDKLTLEEICQKNLTSYNLVTLSACETAITGNQTITTEYVGLVSGFLSQGVAHVVSTLWTVESAATALVMIEFYRRRQAGKSEAVALAETTQWLKNLTVQQLKEWYEAFLTQLPPDELRISAFLETEEYRLGRMEPDKKLYNHPYYWAAFTIIGKPC